MSAHMATAPHKDTGQFMTHLFVSILPLFIHYLVSHLLKLSPVDRYDIAKLFWSPPPPGIQKRSRSPTLASRGHRRRPARTIDRTNIVSARMEATKTRKHGRWRSYLFPFLWRAYQVGCCVEVVLRRFVGWLRILRHPVQWWTTRHLALQADRPRRVLQTRFDSDSFAVGVDNHASRCMGNDKRLFENLTLARAAQRVGGISKGLAIEGKGTLVLDVNDDTGKPHRIKIPNSLYLPELRMCLLSPQHWAQEAGDNYPLPNGTRMENTAHNCVLVWGQGKHVKTIPFDPATNTPIFYTSPSTSSYRAFVNTFMACEAPYFERERVLHVPRRRHLDGTPPPPEEFVAEENLNVKEGFRVGEGAIGADDDTVPAGNLPPPPELAPHQDLHQRDALSFDPSPLLRDDEEYSLSAPDDQAKLMRWHYHLGHLPFGRLQQLARNGGIPKKLADVRPPRCAGCLYGAMTKEPWRTKQRHEETHPVFAATKPGKCVSVNHMQLLEPGFYGQAKGGLTKTRYRNATVFVDHYS